MTSRPLSCLLVLLGATVACTRSDSIQCGTVTCPGDAHCGPGNECVPKGCGDGVVTGLETCDGDLGSLTCSDFGYTAGALACSPVCQIDTDRCLDACGNHVVDTAELCDGIPPAGFSCTEFGYDVGPVLCSSACSPSFALCGSIGWKTAAGGGTNELRGILARDTNAGIAVGFGGLILRSVDGVWSPMQSPTTEDLYGIAGTDTNAIAVGAAGTTLLFDGTTWSVMSKVTDKDLYAVAATSATTGIAVGQDGVILDFDGTAWSVAAAGTTGLDLYGVWGAGSDALAVGEAGTALRRQSGSWSAVTDIGASTSPTVHLRSVFAVDGEVFVGGDNHQLFHRVGTSWQSIVIAPSPYVAPTAAVYSLWATTKNDVFVGMQGGALLHWNGSALSVHASPTTRSIFSLSGVSPARVFAATRGGEVLEYNGTSRRVERPPVGNGAPTFNAVYKAGGTYYVASSGGDVLEYDGAWSNLTVPGEPLLNTVWSDGSNVWVGGTDELFYRGAADSQYAALNVGAGANGIDGTTSPSRYLIAVGTNVYESTNGATWIQDTAAPNADNVLRAVTHTPDGVWFAVGDHGFAMRRTGTTGLWTLMSTNTTENFQAVWGPASNDVFAVGTHGQISHYNGTTWRVMFTGSGENFTAVHGNSHDDVYATATNRTLFHFDGTSWSPMSTSIDAISVWADLETTLFVGIATQVDWLERVKAMDEVHCSDPWDDDFDGKANCADPACASAPTCQFGGVCTTFTKLTCGDTQYAADTYTGIVRIDDLPCLDHSTPGPEASFRFVAQASGPVTITMTDPGGHLDLAVAPALAGSCQLDACTAGAGTGSTKSVTFDAVAQRMYYVLVDGPVYTAEDFTLDVSCP